MLACAITVWGIDGDDIWNMPIIFLAWGAFSYFTIKHIMRKKP